MSINGILEAFTIESAEILEGVEAAILDLEAGREGALDRLYRHIHTLKGSSGIVGLDHLQAFCHAFESRLSLLRKVPEGPKNVVVPALLACRDRVAAILAASTPTLGAESHGQGDKPGLSPAEESVLGTLDAAMEAAATPAGPHPSPEPAPGTGPEHDPARDPRRGQDAYARVSSAKLERVLSLSGEVAIALSNLSQNARQAGNRTLLDELAAVESLAGTLYRAVLDTRMVPFSEVAERYRRSVEEIARGRGRQIRFVLEGADTEIEKGLADHLAEPLLHLVRNAADHGIEDPETRRAAGKDSQGLVTLGARRVSGHLLLTVEDDGAGIDPEAVRARALAQGILGPEERPGVAALYDLLFMPGFSLSGAVTRWSGRGVGLDVVKKSVENLRGGIQLSSSPGRGSTATIRLPLSLSLVEGFVAWAAGLQLLVPFEAAAACIEVDLGDAPSRTFTQVELRGSIYAAVDLSALYATLPAGLGPAAPPSRRRHAILLDGEDTGLALLVDGVGETLSAAVRPLEAGLGQAPGLSSYAIRGDGSLLLVLDAPSLVRAAHRLA